MKLSFEITYVSISCDVPDFSREHKPFLTWDPGRSSINSLRTYQRLKKSVTPLASIRKRFAVLAHRFWSAVAGADIPLNLKIGGGLILPHPNGIVIHPDAVIGPNCLIFQQVTIGTRGHGGVPAIGGHVDIGAGAKVLGPIRIGNHVVIGANSVVLQDVPDNCMAVGIPAIVKLLGGRSDR